MENNNFQFVPTGYNDQFYSSMYMSLFQKLIFLHGSGMNREAMELFDNTIGHFTSLFDELFVRNIDGIDKYINELEDLTYKQRSLQEYRLKVSEFARLIVRCGVAPKPDVRIDFYVPWDVPKDLKDLSFAGEKKGEVVDEQD